MRTLLTAIAATAILGCASHAPQHPTSPVVTATVSPTPVVRRAHARIAVATPSPTPVRLRSSLPPAAPTPTAPPLVVAMRSPAASARPTITAEPTELPTQTPSPAPVPTVAVLDGILQLPPDAAPQITAMHIDRTTVRGGDTVSGSVVTSSNVASVEARIGYYSIPVPKIAIGHFEINYVVPYLPFFLHRTYTMQVIARNAAGVAVVRTIPIKVR